MNPQLQVMLQQAIQAFQNGNFERADSILKKVLQSDSRNLIALNILGLILVSQAKYKEAVVFLERAAQINPKDASIQYNLAKALADSGNDKDALNHHKEAVKLAPHNLQAWLNFGLTTFNLGFYEDALVIYDKALTLKSDYVEALANKGITLKALKRYEESTEFIKRALALNPSLAEDWIHKGVTLNQLKRFDEAITNFNNALEINPSIIDAWGNRGVSFYELNRFDEALASYEKVLSLNPSDAKAWANIGLTLHALERFDEALTHYDKALAFKPDYHEVWTNKGVTLHVLERFDEAFSNYDKALALMPDYDVAWYNKGNNLHKLKRYYEAIAEYDKALFLKPDYAEVWYVKGNVLYELERFDEAIVHYDKALALKPDYHEAWTNKGAALQELKRFDESFAHFDKALSFKHDDHEAWTSKGNLLYELKRFDEAITHYDKALSLKPDYAQGWSNKGSIYNLFKRFDEAITHYDKALSLKPDIDWVAGYLLSAKMRICNWQDFTDSLDSVTKKVAAKQKVVNPFVLLALSDDPFLHKKSAEIYIQSKHQKSLALGPIPRRPKNKKMRIGYFSADFRNHPIAYLIAELLELHDRSQFETYAFSLLEANDEMRGRLFKSFDHFIDAEALTDVAIAELARSLCIDIAVDLTGFTQGTRTGIFSYRAAPIQVNYLGYPGTMGVDYIDYIIADKTLIPTQSQQFYTEKVVYLPNSYQVNDRKRLISDRQFTRRELRLPEHGFVFCCFNNNFKILPAILDGWVRILNTVEGSVLWLLEDNPWAVENLKKEVAKRGVDLNRLIFAEQLPLPEHLARYRQADLFLDTFPYNAHTTCSDALWAGVPVLTMMGVSFASRVAASLLNAIGLSELITGNQEEYEALAIELAKSPQKLAGMKQKLSENRLTGPLFDTPLFAKNIEAAFIKMYDRYEANLLPENI